MWQASRFQAGLQLFGFLSASLLSIVESCVRDRGRFEVPVQNTNPFAIFLPRFAQALSAIATRVPGLALCLLRSPARTNLHWGCAERIVARPPSYPGHRAAGSSEGEWNCFGTRRGRFASQPAESCFGRETSASFSSNSNLLPALKAAENASGPPDCSRMKRREPFERATKGLLDPLGAQWAARRLPSTLSGGYHNAWRPRALIPSRGWSFWRHRLPRLINSDPG